MLCPSCNTDNPADAAFCEQCGSKLEVLCPGCGAPVSPGARFCRKCGAAIGASSGPPAGKSNNAPIRVADASVSENLEGERKTVTALFADIKGSTELMEDLDPEEARAIVDPALKLMIDAVRRYDGYVVQSTGDGIFALFGAPVAHEDHPQRALYAALRLQDATRAYSAKLVADGGTPLEAWVGSTKSEERNFAAELCRLRGELLLMRARTERLDSNAEAQALFLEAIEIARHQHAKSLELRATISLARLLASQGRRDEARALLAEIYNWFTEGFDTADLKEAKALLEELSN